MYSLYLCASSARSRFASSCFRRNCIVNLSCIPLTFFWRNGKALVMNASVANWRIVLFWTKVGVACIGILILASWWGFLGGWLVDVDGRFTFGGNLYMFESWIPWYFTSASCGCTFPRFLWSCALMSRVYGVWYRRSLYSLSPTIEVMNIGYVFPSLIPFADDSTPLIWSQ